MKLSKKRAAAVVLGILIALTLLEVGLRAGGFVVISMQRSQNELPEDGIYRILALGESTTANLRNGQSSWPEELEKILNNRSDTIKFEVYNEGIAGTTTTKILEKLDGDIERYQPHLVISMMGINDDEKLEKRDKNKIVATIEWFRVYKLINLIIINFKNKNEDYSQFKNISDTTPAHNDSYFEKESALKQEVVNRPNDINSIHELYIFYKENKEKEKALETLNKKSNYNLSSEEYRMLGIEFGTLGEYEKADIMLKKAVATDPSNVKAFITLGEHYTYHNLHEESIKAFQLAIQLNPEFNRGVSYGLLCDEYLKLNRTEDALNTYAIYFSILEELKITDEDHFIKVAELFVKSNRSEKAQPIFKKVAEKNPNNWVARWNMAYYHLENGKAKEAEQLFDEQAGISLRNLQLIYEHLGSEYYVQGRFIEANEMFERAKQIRTEYYNPTTTENYNEIYERLDRADIQLIAMQYPTIHVGELKALFDDNENIIFVSNEENFKKTLETMPYDEIFIDHARGTFGHTTRKGNHMIAENAAKTIMAEAGVTSP